MTQRALTILVTDGEQRSSLAIVRSLGRAGHHVHVGSSTGTSISGASRFAASEISIPNPLAMPQAFVEALSKWARSLDADMLIPVTEATLRAVLGRRTELNVNIPFPSLSVFELASDKRALLEVARSVGVAVPEQVVVEDADTTLVPDVLFPVVAKPYASIVGGEGVQQKLTVQHAADRKALATILQELPNGAFPVLVQQRIIGDGVGVFLLRWDGRIVAAFAHRRLREKPPSGGVSTYRESIPLPDSWLNDAERLLESLQWQGVAMIEFKIDQATGRPTLMEINGRFWGSLQLAIDAGVDFPGLLVQAAIGKPLPERPPYSVGIRSRWFWGDVDNLILRLTRTRRVLNLPDEAPGRFRCILNFLRFGRRGDRLEVWRVDDLHPFFRESWKWLRRS